MFDKAAQRGFINSLTVNVAKMNAEQSTALMVRVARGERDRVLRGQPRPSGYRQVVDGIEGKALEAVKPDGVILFAWQYLGLVVMDTYNALVNRSPRLTGGYITGLLIFADSVQVQAPSVIDQAGNFLGNDVAEVKIVASVPYARRLEVGRRRDGGAFVQQVKPHIVEETAIVARKLYGTLAAITYGYTDLTGAHVLRNASGHRRSRGRVITDVQYPCITIRPSTA